MSIVRVKKRNSPYVQIDKRSLQDKRLSWKARGILAYLMSKPDNWAIRPDELIEASAEDGRMAVRTALKELAEFGYAELIDVRNEKGHLQGREWTVYERPIKKEGQPKDRKTERPKSGLSVEDPETGLNSAEDQPKDHFSDGRETGPYTNTKSNSPNGEAGKPASDAETPKAKPLGSRMVVAFLALHKVYFSPGGQWVGFEMNEKEAGNIKHIEAHIAGRLKKKSPAGEDPTDDQVLAAFEKFLNTAATVDNGWYLRNCFTPSKLYSNYQDIVQKAAAPPPPPKPGASSAAQPEHRQPLNVPTYGTR